MLHACARQALRATQEKGETNPDFPKLLRNLDLLCRYFGHSKDLYHFDHFMVQDLFMLCWPDPLKQQCMITAAGLRRASSRMRSQSCSTPRATPLATAARVETGV